MNNNPENVEHWSYLAGRRCVWKSEIKWHFQYQTRWYSSKSRLEGITSILVIRMIGTIQLSWQFSFSSLQTKANSKVKSQVWCHVRYVRYHIRLQVRLFQWISVEHPAMEWLKDSDGWFWIFLWTSSCNRKNGRRGCPPASGSRCRCRRPVVEAVRFASSGGSSGSRPRNPTMTNTCRRFRVPESDLFTAAAKLHQS